MATDTNPAVIALIGQLQTLTAAFVAAVTPAPGPTPVPTPAPTLAPVAKASANLTVVTGTTGSITDASLNKWAITAGGQVAVNGTTDTTTMNVVSLAYVGGTVWQENTSGLWYGKASSAASWLPAEGTAASPLVATRTATAVPTKYFTATPGGFLDPSGAPFKARGAAIFTNFPAVAELLQLFPGINYIRIAVNLGTDSGDSGDGGATGYNFNQFPPSAFTAFVTAVTALGIVCNLENHSFPQSNSVQTGAQLAAEAAWYGALAAEFADNPNVWFSTNNEPAFNNGGGSQAPVTEEQVAIYDAIRGAGNGTVILLELIGGGDTGYLGTNPQSGNGLTASADKTMTNVGLDLHNYAGGNTGSVATFTAIIQGAASLAQQITCATGVMPVLIGEYGNSEIAASVDAGWLQCCEAAQAWPGGACAWIWGGGPDDVDNLVLGSGALTDFGTQVSNAMGTAPAKLP
jgi:Cellulase (glycosyl hydrolase family 5)